MELELSPEQINQIVRAARVLAPGFTEERLKWLIDGQKRLADFGFCKASWAVARFERERGVNCADVLDACEGVLQEMAKLEGVLARLEEKLQAQRNANREAEEKYRQVIEATEQARKELAETRAEREREERKLVAYRKKTEAEMKRIDQEVEEYRQKASVTEQEMDAASELKAQVGSCGFSLEQVLGLSQEFAGHQDAREKLAAGLKKYRSLTGYLEALEKWAEEKKSVLESGLSTLESQRNWQQEQVDNLGQDRRYLETVIAQLQADVIAEEEMRRFYRRYYGVSGLMEYLASWKQVFFWRCNHPLSVATGVFDQSAVAHFWTDRLVAGCPHCGSDRVVFDEKPYQTLNWPVGVPLKLQLGE